MNQNVIKRLFGYRMTSNSMLWASLFGGILRLILRKGLILMSAPSSPTYQQRSGQIWSADLVQRHSELDPVQLGVVLTQLVLAARAGGHHGPHVTDPVVDVRHQRPPATHRRQDQESLRQSLLSTHDH